MVRSNTPQHYDGTARAFHWIATGIVIVLAGLGFYMTRLDFSDLKVRIYTAHETIGLVLFALTIARLAWRMRHPPPPLPPSAWIEQVAAHASHAALYAILLAMPIFGFLGSNAYGFPVRPFGLFELPNPIGSHEEIGEILLGVHSWLALGLTGIASLHAVVALHHHFVRRDGILRRMLPSLRLRRDD
jgi:cytochrome b561